MTPMRHVLHNDIKSWLEKTTPGMFALYAGLAAFTTYCGMYALRKPYAAAEYTDLIVAGVNYKILLVVAQVTGYSIAKFFGIKLISVIQPQHRVFWLAGLLGSAWLSLVGFGLTPYPWNAVWMLLNGFPLGLIWGLVFSYIEGRRVTEAIAAMLSANFILSSGMVKSIGMWALQHGVSEFWMPALVGACFLPLLVFSIYGLEQLPPPGIDDKLARHARRPMTYEERLNAWQQFAPGLILLIFIYLLLTVVRDVRDNFSVEIWRALGYSDQPSILTLVEIPVALFSLLGIAGLVWVRKNFKALWYNHLMMFGGGALLGLSTILWYTGLINPVLWMILSGIAMFVPYILFNGSLFDRLMAAFKQKGNVGFMMYLADSIGYLGSVGVLVWRNFMQPDVSWISFYTALCCITSVVIMVLSVFSFWYFKSLKNEQKV